MSSSDNAYKKIQKPRAQQIDIQKNEIRITAQGRSRNYISYAVGLLDISLLQKDEGADASATTPQQFDSVVLKAMGKAIQKAVTIAEVLKRRVAGLHQITSIESQEIEDQYEPKEEGMDIVTKKRTVSSIIIELSKKPLDTKALGYQPPIPEDQVTAPQILSERSFRGQQGGQGGAGGAGKRRRRPQHARGGNRGGHRGAGRQQQQQGTTGAATQEVATKEVATTGATQGAATQQGTTGTTRGGRGGHRGGNRGGRGRGGRGGRGGNRGGAQGGQRAPGQPGQPRKAQNAPAATTQQQE